MGEEKEGEDMEMYQQFEKLKDLYMQMKKMKSKKKMTVINMRCGYFQSQSFPCDTHYVVLMRL